MNSSTFSSKRWLQIFLGIVLTTCVTFTVASEWMLRTYVLPVDNFEWIAKRLRDSKQSNAAFGDSHVAAVPDYNTNDFVNLGVGATTIRKMASRVRYYFSHVKPGEVIIQADPHLFAEYRLQAQGSYVAENYSDSRLRIFDPVHRGFMRQYWTKLIMSHELKEKENTSYDRLWESANKGQPATSTSAPAPEKAAPPEERPSDAAKPTPPNVATEAAPSIPVSAGPANPPPLPVATAPAASTLPPEIKTGDAAEFNAFMDYEVRAHTPVANFRERDEARIYKDMLDFLIARGAKVCLVNYPVDKFYRERADAIPLFAEVRDFYKEIAQERHIPYVSFWSRFDDPKMFQNTDHVNQNGSPILAAEARKACFGKSS